MSESGIEVETITVPIIVLRWSSWVSWLELALDARAPGRVRIPNNASGVYEVRQVTQDERLAIGKARNLRFRIKQGLVRGKARHRAGEAIRAAQDVARLEVRWAETDRPAAAEEDLHRRYRARFGSLPRYTFFT